jgi:hypothetical protein
MTLHETETQELWAIFKGLGKEALSYSHYDLHTKCPAYSADTWKTFLMLPEVSEWVRTEHSLLQDSELRKLLSNISSSRSVGQAQLINSLTKIADSGGAKDGPAFIYTYVPLDNQQAHASNVRTESKDIFLIP